MKILQSFGSAISSTSWFSLVNRQGERIEKVSFTPYLVLKTDNNCTSPPVKLHNNDEEKQDANVSKATVVIVLRITFVRVDEGSRC